MIELARVQQSKRDDIHRSIQQRLEDAISLVENLAVDMPTQVELAGLFQLSLVPPRLVAVREAMRYRMVELSKNACDCFRRSQAVAGTALTRAAFETSSLVFHIEKRVSSAVTDRTLGDIGQFLLQSLLGLKDKQVLAGAKHLDQMPTAVNVLTSVAHLEKQYPGAASLYATLCEITHPNQLGGLIAYGTHEKGFILKLAANCSHGASIHPILCHALIVFEHHYNRIADVFPAFVELCRLCAPRTVDES